MPLRHLFQEHEHRKRFAPLPRSPISTLTPLLTQIFDTTFCGSWAGAVWGQSSCATVDASCADYVARNPQAYADGYWLVVGFPGRCPFREVAADRRDRTP